jgi:protein-disulfide isomerase
MLKKSALLLAASATLLTGCWGASGQQLSEDDVKRIVDDYIKNDTGKVLDAINAYAMQQQEAARQKAEDEAFNNPIKDTIAAHTPVWGSATAPITIIEYSDFQCPYCARAHQVVQQLKQKYGADKIRIAYKHLPLGFHENARPAALAAQAANRQGKFWEFHDQLFANQDNLSEATLVKIATELKLDLKKFNADRASPDIAKEVDADLADAQRLQIQGTPNFLVNGVPLRGAMPIEQFDATIARLTGAAQQGAQPAAGQPANGQ